MGRGDLIHERGCGSQPENMAELQVKKVLEKEVTCPLCLDIFQDPKKLPCDHVYCRTCLERLANRIVSGPRGVAPLSCPECRTLVQIPNGDVHNFPTAFRLNRLVEAFQRVEISEETDSDTQETPVCRDHPTQAIAIYCETCNKLLCRDCVLATREHTDHSYGFIEEMRGKLQGKLSGTLSVIKKKEKNVSKAIDDITSVENEIAAHEEQCQLEIDQSFEVLYQKLQENKRKMKEQAAQHFHSAKSLCSERKESLVSIKNEMEAEVELATQSLQESDEIFLTRHASIQQNLNLIQKRLGKTPLNPLSKPSFLALKSMTGEELQELLEKQNELYAIDPTKWQVSGSLFDDPLVNQRYVVTVQRLKSGAIKLWKSQTSSGKGVFKCTAELLSIKDNTIVKGEVWQNSHDRFTVTMRPSVRGRHKLNIKINGVHIAESPYAVLIKINPELFKQPVAEITGLPGVVSLCHSAGNTILATQQEKVIKISPDRAISTLFELQQVEEMTFDPTSNAIYVTTISSDQVHKFTSSGDLIKSIGGGGREPGQFDFPNGLRVSTKGELYVCDGRNHRIQIFDVDLNFRRILSGVGLTGAPMLHYPSDVEFDSSGKIYIANNQSWYLHVFTPDEQFLFIIGNQQSQLLNNPVSLVIRGKLLYVTEYKEHRVSVLTTSGELVARLGFGYLQKPEGIAIDEDGYICVTSHSSKIIVF